MNQLADLLNELKDKKLPSKTGFGHYAYLAGKKARPREQQGNFSDWHIHIKREAEKLERVAERLNRALSAMDKAKRTVEIIEEAKKNNNGLVF